MAGLEEVNLFQMLFPFGGALLKALSLCSEVTRGQENEWGLARPGLCDRPWTWQVEWDVLGRGCGPESRRECACVPLVLAGGLAYHRSGQIWPTAYLCAPHKLRIVFTF